MNKFIILIFIYNNNTGAICYNYPTIISSTDVKQNILDRYINDINSYGYNFKNIKIDNIFYEYDDTNNLISISINKLDESKELKLLRSHCIQNIFLDTNMIKV